jgi:DnaJ-class molecular chaperone
MAKMYFNRSVVHAKLGNNTEAIEDCGRTITLDGSYYKAWAKRGSLYMENNNYVEAIRDFEEAYSLKCCPESFRNLEEAKKKKRKMESRKPNHYMVLGVDRKAGYEDIKKAYRSKAREFHPDKHANASDDEREEMEARMKEIAAAHSCLSDPGKKKTYDERLEREDQMDDSDYDFSDDEYDDDLFEFDVNDFFFQLFGGRFGVYMGGGGLGGRKRSNVYTFRR